MSETVITREMLYQEVWTDPVAVVAPRYGISGVALAKVCKKHRIPIPPRGYWAKIKAGRTPPKLPLSRAPEFDGYPMPLDRSPNYDPDSPKTLSEKPMTALERIGTIEIPPELVSPHPLIRAAAKRLKKKTGWDNYKGLRSAPDEVFNIEVTKGSLDRALLLADTLIKALETHGVSVQLNDKKAGSVVCIGSTSLPISITEHVARSKHEVTPSEKRAIEKWQRSPNRWSPGNYYPHPPDYDYTPTGKLTISIGLYPSRSWSDTPKTALENRLHQVVAGVQDLLEEHRLYLLEQQRREIERQRARERYERQVERRKQEKRRLESLESEAIRWADAERLRRYIEAVENSAVAKGEMTEELKAWIDWARLKADCRDPLIPVSDAVLDGPEPEARGYHYW